ncbi:TonB-dependent receptor [Chryseobacterium flavum]|uniref:TonB-dependent receptor n=1 Tax=Chryseobacterium flavum TaxID=415851 RepID=A0A3D9CQ81_9FLAO|nr:TonB-dependent receptor [Chryseobacterium flavum]REC67920.1 TonB-dependent receptor [Chryseobacterium flavum]
MERKRLFLTKAAFFLLGPLAFAQTTVHGIVVDNEGNLPNALVYIKDTGEKITSDTDGSFVLNNVHDGKYQLIVEYKGYDSMHIPFLVSDKKEVDLGLIRLGSKPKENNIQEVIVTSVYKASQARAITMKKNSNTITEVLSADAIGKLPDRNAADAVQRMQGVSIERDMGEGRFVAVRGTPVQWTASTLNGNRMPSASGDNANRGVQMDIFPSELIQNVRLSKALTPDLDGDAIGGNVDFITKTSPNKETLAISTASGYVNMSRSPTYNTSVVYGNKITNKLKFISSAVIWERYTAIDQMRNIFNYGLKDKAESYSINQLQLRDYQANRRTLGFNLGVDYEIDSRNKLYFKGLYSQYKDGQSVRETYFNFDNKNVMLQARHADYITGLYSMQIGGAHQVGRRMEISWSLSKARSEFKFNSPGNLDQSERGYPIVNFIQPMTYGSLSANGRKYMAMDAPDGIGDTGEYTLPYNQQNISADKLKLNQIILSQNHNSETDLRGQADLKYKVSDNFELKFGTKYNNKEKIVNSSLLVWMPKSSLGVPGAPVSYLNQFNREDFPYRGGFMNPLGNPYNAVIIDQITNGQIDQMYNTAVQNSLGLAQVSTKDSNSNITSSYRGTENVWASYLMGTWKVSDHIQLLGGLRNEYNDVTFWGKKVISDKANRAEDIKDNKTYNVLLPMVNMKWNLSDNRILRLAYTRSFARPDFNDLNPGTIVNDISNTITQGNTKLDPTFSNNFDMMFENYFGKLDLITAGVFYKDITNLIYKDQSVVNIDGRSYTFTAPKNLEGARLFGFEFGISKRFENLPGFLKNIGFEGNYTYISSKMNMPVYENGKQTGTMSTTIPNQAKHIFNTILFYETSKLMLRLAGNYKGNYVSEIRAAAGADHYQYFDKNFTVDLSTSYAITRKVRLFIELNNIFNEPNRYYMGVKDRVENISYSGIRGQLGVNFNF